LHIEKYNVNFIWSLLAYNKLNRKKNYTWKERYNGKNNFAKNLFRYRSEKILLEIIKIITK